MKCLSLIGCGLIYTLTFFSNQQDELKKSIDRGKPLYMENCVTCHLGKGEGVKGTFPPLAKADFLLQHQDKAIHAIKYGMQGPVRVNGVLYNSVMPPSGLEDDEVADLMNYINNSFGNKNSKIVTPKMVSAIKEKK